MKVIIKALAISVAITSPVMAASEETCRTAKEIAESVMSARQSGVDIVQMMDIANKTEGPLGNLTKKMTIDAYSFPQFSTDEYRKKGIAEFGTRHYINCIKWAIH